MRIYFRREFVLKIRNHDDVQTQGLLFTPQPRNAVTEPSPTHAKAAAAIPSGENPMKVIQPNISLLSTRRHR